MTAKESKAVGWSCALSLRVAVIDENGVPQLSLNGSGIPSGVSLFHEDHVHTLNAFIKKMDGIIEEVGGVTASCINPYEDLKRALIGQKERAIKAESALHAAEAELGELRRRVGDLPRFHAHVRFDGKVHLEESCDGDLVMWKHVAPPIAQQGGGEPPPNWCMTCGKHRDAPDAVFCSDGIHNRKEAALASKADGEMK